MFDLVHLRFMFAPYGRDDELLARALTLLRPGGVLVVQEPDASCWSTMPPHPAFEELKSLIFDAFRRGGGDFNAGQRIFRRLRRGGLQIAPVHRFQFSSLLPLSTLDQFT